MQALKDLKILDFGWVIAAPLATSHLGDFGATVVRIETERRVDALRTMTPFAGNIPGINRSGYFAVYNNSKYSMQLDLKHPKAKEIIHKLVLWADIVVENFTAGTMESLGLGYDDLVKINPKIIMISDTYFGHKLADSKVPSIGNLMQAKVGFFHLTGWPDRPPVPPSAAIPDYVTPMYVIISLMAALDYRNRTGKGLYMDVSMYGAGLQMVATAMMDYEVNGRLQTRNGNRTDGAAPHGVFPCKNTDSWCAISVKTDSEWESLCREMNYPAWANLDKFRTVLGRIEFQDELEKNIGEWTSEYTANEVMHRLQAAGVTAAIVATGEDLDEDPQLKAVGHYVQVDHSEMGKYKCEAPAFILSETPASIKPAPCLGEHTFLVATEILGMDSAEFLKLQEEGLFI